MDFDAKDYVDHATDPVMTRQEALHWFQDGFSDVTVEFCRVDTTGVLNTGGPSSIRQHVKDVANYRPLWHISGTTNGTLEQVQAKLREKLAGKGLYPIKPPYVESRIPHRATFRTCRFWVPGYAIATEAHESLAVNDIVRRLIEDDNGIDAKADFMRLRPEVRLFDRADKKDVILIDDTGPLYIGTLGPKGNWWRIAWLAPKSTGRVQRTELAKYYPDAEQAAEHLVTVMQPWWQAVLFRRNQDVALAESDEDIDPKDYALAHVNRVYLVRGADGAVEKVCRRRERAFNYASNINGGRVSSVSGHSPIVRAYAIANGGIDESDADIDPKDYVMRVMTLSSLDDLKRFPKNQVYLCHDPKLMEIYGGPVRCWKPIWKGGGIVSICYDNKQPSNFVSTDFVQLKHLVPFMGHGDDPVTESWGDDKETIDAEAAKAEKPASPEQAEAGNYKKGHVSVQGIPIAIENAKGSTRSGTNKQGVKWSVTMPAHYGYVKKSESKDGDSVDVYIGGSPSSMLVFVINQKKEDSKAFDEHKCMLGFKSKEEAIAAYDGAFSGDLGPKLRDEVISCTVDQFKEWLKSGDTEKPFKLDESLRSPSARIIALKLLDIT